MSLLGMHVCFRTRLHLIQSRNLQTVTLQPLRVAPALSGCAVAASHYSLTQIQHLLTLLLSFDFLHLPCDRRHFQNRSDGTSSSAFCLCSEVDPRMLAHWRQDQALVFVLKAVTMPKSTIKGMLHL